MVFVEIVFDGSFGHPLGKLVLRNDHRFSNAFQQYPLDCITEIFFIRTQCRYYLSRLDASDVGQAPHASNNIVQQVYFILTKNFKSF